ncbi:MULTISPECIES: prephenate dehydratase [unclassified Hyphomonas]|jgi:prephenate dehydratase|uniref:prephenate dehydratase n=1 Tax=unclassified Hyphomonas TaxID=2630699 RepID=UPI0004591272|nr:MULTISPECIES: prephenate dehydratase [unclassified Hyphomonas]KCZ48927.1 prephenate dehydratase [Hyphomonas sp. CY54-11-8]RAN40374.1 prephenate dehydratase [Hyphomonas sp. GM-8P]
MTGKIAYQGEPGANSHIACNQAFPALEPLPCRTFEDCFAAVEKGEADLAMIPVENTIAGRVSDIHSLLPGTSLQIVAEHYLPIRFQLMALPGVKLEEVKKARSHIMGLGQCRKFLREHGIDSVTASDTAGAAREVAESGDRTLAAIAPRLAAEVYGLEILAEDIEDAAHNTTRFVIMSREPSEIELGDGPAKTAFLFEVRNIPAALFKVLGGFATNGINMTKLESYMVGGNFTATQFYAEIEGHPDERSVQLALEEVGFFTQMMKLVGVFPAAGYREG